VALQSAGALLRSQGADHREGDRAPVVLQAKGTGGEADPVGVPSAKGREPGEADPTPRAPAGLRGGPVLQCRHQIGYPRGVGLLRVLGPPRGNICLLTVPALAERRQGPGDALVGQVRRLGLQVGLHVGQRPVVGEAPGTEVGVDDGAVLRPVDLEGGTGQRPARRDGALPVEEVEQQRDRLDRREVALPASSQVDSAGGTPWRLPGEEGAPGGRSHPLRLGTRAHLHQHHSPTPAHRSAFSARFLAPRRP
jgi:hypothetical protein